MISLFKVMNESNETGARTPYSKIHNAEKDIKNAICFWKYYTLLTKWLKTAILVAAKQLDYTATGALMAG